MMAPSQTRYAGLQEAVRALPRRLAVDDAVIAACTLEEGRRFDTVRFDLTIPGGMGGVEALAELRAIDPDVNAIVSSVCSNDPVPANTAPPASKVRLPSRTRLAK